MTIRARYYGADEFFEIHGSRGIIWVTRCTGEMLDMPAVVLLRGTETVSYQVPADWRLGFDGAAADFVDGLLAGRQPAQDVNTAKHILSVPLGDLTKPRATGRPVAPAPAQIGVPHGRRAWRQYDQGLEIGRPAGSRHTQSATSRPAGRTAISGKASRPCS